MNKAESERLGSCFEQMGYRATERTEEADLIVLNSCVVRQSAENRVINKPAGQSVSSLQPGGRSWVVPQKPVLPPSPAHHGLGYSAG